MPTTADYLNDLVAQKKTLAEGLVANGVEASENETFGELVRKSNSEVERLHAIYEGATNNGKNFGTLFEGCTTMVSSPWMDTSQGTNFNSMYSGCSSLIEIPDMDFSLGQFSVLGAGRTCRHEGLPEK